ncbi:MAG: histidine--tRNA ligase [Methylotenera sp.]|jgi:histidyl-tRNA synthetase|uniref:Histidine--tRNA ligase n=1 Tax=Methylotenera mobilis TaxID=359408 RepID=A0A351RBR8_9PROT|nr:MULTISPECIES: histidine--tRNA ligase [Methylotenera]HBA09489.1 histidine--tRNA ligase [Methylotenera mobilis]MDP3211852.1 histidine--tRNA ligase [Methylotenera sp.]PPC96246.1 MAG: histidine--tRNA ligase [Methylotenera sp.]PPD02054.1 MAG: histidine--tRNA ligase [Methylotenera sp.]PPD45084.1 MAG: histidine--tRNA ligase [Methylotenera sp.]
MSNKFQSIKGFYDILPEATPLWFKLEDTARRVLAQYGYKNIRMPLVEPTELFVRSVGEHTDIVEKEMYAWEDALNGDKLTLRPEGTAGCVRAVVEHNLTYNGPQRLWYTGAMFRHENVQKGRQRQFHQIGVEAFGFDTPEVDAEQIVLLARLWRELGIQDVELQINSIGDAHERAEYRNVLIAYFEQHADLLDEDAKRRLHSNPLRILDTKNPRMQAMCESAPKLIDCLGVETRAHFEGLCKRLNDAGVTYTINPRLVRGLDYYNRTVFEWVTTKLGAQGTIAGGGRYDTLVERLGGDVTPACGFGIGLERVFLLMQEYGVQADDAPDVYLVNVGEQAESAAFSIAEQLRNANIQVVLHAGGGSFKSQMKKADRSHAKYALILGDDEVANQQVTLKPMLATVKGEQQRLSVEAAITYLTTHLS